MVPTNYNEISKDSEIFKSVIDLDDLSKIIKDLFPLVLQDEDLSDSELDSTTYPTPQDFDLYISREVINLRTQYLRKQILEELGDDFVIVYLADGAIPFHEEFIKGTNIDSYKIKVKSYEGNKSTDKLKIIEPINSEDIKDKKVLLLDDIIDTGNTSKLTQDYLLREGATNVKTCFLLDKISQRKNGFVADYTGFIIPNDYVIGFGMDIELNGKEYARSFKHIYKNNPK